MRTVRQLVMLMVCGCMSSNGLGQLKFVEGITNSLKYQDILCDSLPSSFDLLRGERSLIFQQDLVPMYNSKSTNEWITADHIDVFRLAC